MQAVILREPPKRWSAGMSRALTRGCAAAALLTLLGAGSLLQAEDRSPAARPAQPPGILAEIERATIEIFQRAAPSVVQIAVVTKDGNGTSPNVEIGSGFFWDTSGNIVTNSHVVRDAREIAVWFASGERTSAEIVGVAPTFDLAVIRVGNLRPSPAPIAIGTSRDLKVGQLAFAIGSPFGLEQSLTSGMIGSLKRQLPTKMGRSIANMIQTDAAIHPGNSGGPLLDSSGRLIGVNTIGYTIAASGNSLGFAIPVDVVSRIVPLLIKNGHVPTPGIGIVPADELAALRFGVDGVAIARIRPGSPAEKAALRPMDMSAKTRGDVITHANGHAVRDAFDLTAQLEDLGVGRKIALRVERNGHAIEMEIEIIDLDPKP